VGPQTYIVTRLGSCGSKTRFFTRSGVVKADGHLCLWVGFVREMPAGSASDSPIGALWPQRQQQQRRQKGKAGANMGRAVPVNAAKSN
jgi:hypothetical protein